MGNCCTYIKLFTDFEAQFGIPLVGLMEQAAAVKMFVKAGRKTKEVMSADREGVVPICYL